MRFFELLSILTLTAIANAGPINVVRSSLIPASPPACVAKASNQSLTTNTTSTSNADPATCTAVGCSNLNSTTLAYPPDSSNLTIAANTTMTFNSTSIIDPSDIPDFTNATILSNSTLGGNSTDLGNSASLANSTGAVSTLTGTNTTANNATGSANATVVANTTITTSAPHTSLISVIPRLLRMRKPKFRRIAQADLPAVAQQWQNLCLVSGGDIFTNEPCVQLAGIDGINALLASGDPCAQQDNADAMVDFAKSAGVTNGDALITLAIAYRKHPRNALNINGVVPSTPYCQKSPKNSELAGIVNAQLDGVDPGLFGGPNFPILPFGEDGTCPFGQTPDVSTCSCN
ncbi:hypothetical protein EW146_g7507 [Bondarzewia mesenterica]|uniref:Uncharacterized protein n=1 Tax=Bondarzewia mesenterica TaxID=1095465 RepID=A0A4S4LKL5_9AGAM|nr:hypothetical protein EW146_g7507 [Bondarzewia mesenterica]